MFNYYVLLIVILISFTNCGADSNCCQKVSLDYLDAAADFIAKAKSNFPSQVICDNISVTEVVSDKNKSRNAMDCSELLEMGYKKNGVYTIWPIRKILDDKPLEVYCDMETDGGGWTLLQRRGPFGGLVEDFDKDWKSYKEGFGDLQKEFWLGNDNIFALTNQRLYSARFDLRTLLNQTLYAHYDRFWIDCENIKYTLHITDYKGDAGDFMKNHQSQKFTTKDEDDLGKCAETYGGGWWFTSHLQTCFGGNLNARIGVQMISKPERGSGRLRTTAIKIRPRNFKLPDASLDNAHTCDRGK